MVTRALLEFELLALPERALNGEVIMGGKGDVADKVFVG
jgi:hypothetical protein